MKSNYKQLGQFIRQVDVRNAAGKEENLLGVSVQKHLSRLLQTRSEQTLRNIRLSVVGNSPTFLIHPDGETK